MRRFVLLVTVAAFALVPPALADGLPVLGVDVGSSGVTVSGNPDRYVTVSQGRLTLVERIARDGGRVLGMARVVGNFTIPAVAYDGSSRASGRGPTANSVEPPPMSTTVDTRDKSTR